MAKLIALSPGIGLLPIAHGGVDVTEIVSHHRMSVAPFSGQDKAVSAQLKQQVGGGLTAPNRRSGPATWFGHGTWMVADKVTLDGMAAVTDQSDAWAVFAIAGGAVEDVLARLVPIDLRRQVFKVNHVAKTMLSHLSVTITRIGPQEFEILVMRSMAATLVHDLHVAMRSVASR